MGFLGEFLGKIGLAAARRAVEQHAVGRQELVFLCLLPVAEHPDHPLGQHLLEVFHAGRTQYVTPVAGRQANI